MKSKNIREKGKMKFSRIFQNLKEGDKVALIRELSLKDSFPARMEGKTGFIEGRRGKAYIVKIRDYNEEKTFIVKPINLKKLK